MRKSASNLTRQLDEMLCTTLVNSIRGIVWEADPVTFRFNYVNPQAEHILGYPSRQWVEEPDFWLNHTHPDDVEWCVAYCKSATGKGQNHEFEYRMVAADGSIVWLHDIVTVVTDADGGVRLQGIMIDITESKRSAMKLSSDEERFRLAMLAANDGLYDWNLLTNEVYYSPRWKLMLGYADDELVNRLSTWQHLLHPDDRDSSMRLMQDYIKGGINRYEAEIRLKHKLGHYITVLTRGFLSRDADGNAIRLVGTHTDLTDQRGQEELYSAMFSQAPDGVVLIDCETLEFSEFNNNVCEGHGYTREEFALLTVRDIIVEGTGEALAGRIREIMAKGNAVFETVHRHKDGSLLNVRTSVKTISIRDHAYLVAFWTDLTAQRKLTEALKLHEHFQRALLNNFPFAAWMKDKDGLYRAANRKMAEYYGLVSPDELLGKSVYDFFRPELADRIGAEAREVLESGRPKQSEKRLPVNDGDHWFDIHQSPISIDGQFLGTVGCAWDITERKLMEKALAESEERYRKVVEFSPEAMFIHYQGRFVFMNLAAAKLLGAQHPEELYGQTALEFIHPEMRDTVAKRIENAWQHNDNPLIEELMVRRDGTTVLVEMVSVHLTYQGKESVLAIARDISEKKRMQDELVRTQKLESLGVLAGGIAHDFNNILTGILGNLSLVRMQLDTPENVSMGLERCEKAALRASELTQQLLTFARGGEPVRKLIDPALLIRESVSFVLRGSTIGSEVALANNLWCIEADPGQVNQVLSNILINSMQAMPEGGVIRITSSNEVLLPDNTINLPAGNYLKIAIEDQGHGIPTETMSKIFDPFYTTKEQGNGMGLASVYSIVKRHGGTVAVNSTMGAGSCFTIHLPAAPGKRADSQVAAKEDLLSGKGNVLVMDDEEIIREIVTTTLEFAGYQVESCGDGKEAVERYQSSHGSDTPFDVVIMDLTVPGGMGGKEAAGYILDFDPNAALIVSSGYSSDPVIANFRQFGFKGAVVKPFSAGTLTAEVQRLAKKF